MSLPPGWRLDGSHLESFHTSVNSSVYSRVGDTGAWNVPPGVSGEPHASWVWALLPDVLRLDCPLRGSVSHGPGAWTLTNGPVGIVQPEPCTQQPMTLFAGCLVGDSESRLGFVANRRQRGEKVASDVPGASVSLVVTIAA